MVVIHTNNTDQLKKPHLNNQTHQSITLRTRKFRTTIPPSHPHFNTSKKTKEKDSTDLE